MIYLEEDSIKSIILSAFVDIANERNKFCFLNRNLQSVEFVKTNRFQRVLSIKTFLSLAFFLRTRIKIKVMRAQT